MPNKWLKSIVSLLLLIGSLNIFSVPINAANVNGENGQIGTACSAQYPVCWLC